MEELRRINENPEGFFLIFAALFDITILGM